MSDLLRNWIFLLKSIFQQRIQSIDLSHLFLLIEELGGYRESIIGLDGGRSGGRRLDLLEAGLHDLLEVDVCWAHSIDGPLFDDARPMFDRDLHKY